MKELREWLVAVGTIGATIAAFFLAYQNRELLKLTYETVKSNQEMVKANQAMVRASLPPLVDLWLDRNRIRLRTVTDIMELRLDIWQFLVDINTGAVSTRVSGPNDPRPDPERIQETHKHLKPNTVISKDLTEEAENVVKLKKMRVELPMEFVRGNPMDLEPFLIDIASYRDAKTKAFRRECKIIWISISEKDERILWSSDYLTINPIKELISSIKAELPCL